MGSPAELAAQLAPYIQQIATAHDEILTVAGAAQYLRVSEDTVRRLAYDGKLPCMDFGTRQKEYRFSRNALAEVVRNGGL